MTCVSIVQGQSQTHKVRVRSITFFSERLFWLVDKTLTPSSWTPPNGLSQYQRLPNCCKYLFTSGMQHGRYSKKMQGMVRFPYRYLLFFFIYHILLSLSVNHFCLLIQRSAFALLFKVRFSTTIFASWRTRVRSSLYGLPCLYFLPEVVVNKLRVRLKL